ncbi:ATP-binding cassette sub-family C member Sur isoform X2 [Condylostylus longicornis]|uniref:ATP-binding cassette sub-family C member Sur isoform X2 n=1 Tax=Condylostylus longicornis TaxID=2530218 RepID=UPI00244E43BE|nr:ATP-binding cassette sub-family C member Sur isoform X2 [Condylostylus longicornis]
MTTTSATNPSTTTKTTTAETITTTNEIYPIPILFKFHDIRCACELLLLAINSLEICRSLLPLPFYSVTFWTQNLINLETSTINTASATFELHNNNNSINYKGHTVPLSTPLLMNSNNIDDNDKFQLILHSPPFIIYNSIFGIFMTFILIGYHRILEMRNIPEFLYVSMPLEIVLGIIRIYQIHFNVPSYFDLEPFLNWSTGFCLFGIAIIDGYVLYKQRFKSKPASKKLNEENIGYKHSISTFFSKILFWWLTPFLWYGYREPLEQEDLGTLREEDSARAYYDQFLIIYKKSAKENKNPSLWLCYLKSSWKWFTLGGILKLLGDLSALIGPLSIHQIVDYIEYEYNRSYLNSTSILYNIQNHFNSKYSINYNNNNNNSINNDNNNTTNNFVGIGHMNRMNLFNRNNLNIIWSLLRAHSNYRKLDDIIESPGNIHNVDTLVESATNLPSLNATAIFDNIEDNINDTVTSYNTNHRIEYSHDIIRPIYSMLYSLSEFLPSLTGVNLWANISWIPPYEYGFSIRKPIESIILNATINQYRNYQTNQTDNVTNNDNFNLPYIDSNYHVSQYHTHNYYYYPNWIEFLSNGWIIAWIVLISAIAQGGLSQASTHLLNMTGIRIKTSLQGLIYRKTLLLSSSCIETNRNDSQNNRNDFNSELGEGHDNENQKKKKGNTYNNQRKVHEQNIENPKTNDVKSNNNHKLSEGDDSLKNDNENTTRVNNKKIFGNDNNNDAYSVSGTGNSGGGGKRDAGSITNLMTEDSLNVMSFFWIAHYVWAIPLKIGLVMYLLYLKLGISAIIGSFVCILTMTPLQFLIGKAMSKNSEISAQCTDERLRKINDIFLGIKLIKLNAWEKVYRDKIGAARRKELKYLNKDSFYWTVMTFLTHLSSVLITFVTLAVYVKLETNNLDQSSNKNSTSESSGFESFNNFEFTASRLFSALALFNQLTVPLLIFPITVPIIIAAIISTKRLERFLREPEVQREFEGIKNMARIISKSDAALDMYEIKITKSQEREIQSIQSQEQSNPVDIKNFSMSPINELESSTFDYPLKPTNTEETFSKAQNNDFNQILHNENDTCKQISSVPLLSSSTSKFDTNFKGDYCVYPLDINNISSGTKTLMNNSENKDNNFMSTILGCKENLSKRKSICEDEICEFDKEFNEIDDEFDMENKPLTTLTPTITNRPQQINNKIQQCFDIDNSNNNNEYCDDFHQNNSKYKNNNNINNNDSYNLINNNETKDIFTLAIQDKHETEKEKRQLREFEESQGIQISNDSPRTSINSKLKREYKSHTLPKKRRNKDLIRGGGGGLCGKNSTPCEDNNIQLRNKHKILSSTDHNEGNLINVHDSSTGILVDIKHPTIRNSRKLISGRESFQFQIADDTAVSISDGIFSWDNCNIALKINNLNIPRGKLTVVVGKNGSGKTSLLAALLKEMHQISGEISWNKYSTTAYVPQMPWLLNASIRDNILFGESFRPKRYEKVLESCALKPDIDLMPEGDMTLIGERGINLSGGQKQRINIARSLYSSANVVMMDDPLSSLDNEVAKHVFENSIKKMLLKANRTVILVTQKLQLLSSANYIIVMKDCSVQSAGNYEQIENDHPEIVTEWKALIAKGLDKDQISPGKTARERWRLFKNVSRIGLLRPQDSDQEHLLSTQSLYMQTKRRSSIFGSRHLIYDIPLPIDECQNDDIIIKRRGSKRSILLMGLGNAISGTNSDLRHNDGNNSSSGYRRKNSVLRVKSLQPEVKTNINRTPVSRNISSPGRFIDTKSRINENEFKPKTGFRQFLNRMSSRKSNLGTKLHRPISESNSIQSISEESHPNLQRVESSSCSSEFLDDGSVHDLNNENNENTGSPYDDERKYGEIPLQIYMLYLKSCGLPIVLTFFITALIWQCLRIYTDVWLRYWTEMDSSYSTIASIGKSATETLKSSIFYLNNNNSDINSSKNFNYFNNNFHSINYNNNDIDSDNNYYNGGSSNGITSIFNIENDTREYNNNNYEQQQQQQQQQYQTIYDVAYCFNMYTIISSICILMSIISIPAGQKAGCNAREKLHDQLLESLLAKPLHFFQITSLGKIINRFSNDMAIIDKKIAPTSQRLLQFTLLCLCAVLINLAITPWFIILTIPICFAYYIIQKFYRCSSRELQRLENITNSPVISHFNETIQGVTTIRAYSQESRFTETLFRRLEANTIAFVMLNTSNRWLGIALDYLGGVIVFVAIITALLAASIAKEQQNFHSPERFYSNNYHNNNNQQQTLYSTSNNYYSNSNRSTVLPPSSSTSSPLSGDGMNFNYDSNNQNIYFENSEDSLLFQISPSPSLVGLAINYTLLVPIYLNWVVKLLSDMEMYVGSVERIAYYQQKLNENLNTFWQSHNDNNSQKRNSNHHQYNHHCNHNHKQKEENNTIDCGQQHNNHSLRCQVQISNEKMQSTDSAKGNLQYDEKKSKEVMKSKVNDIPGIEKEKSYYDKVEYNSQAAGKCYCNEQHELIAPSEVNQVIYDTVPISWPQKGDIEFKNVTLRYQGQQKNVITDLSLKISSGQKIGICGRTGSGKSTLALSLFSVMDVINGQILIDGIDINSIHPDEVRSRLSIIPQDVHLFSATIRENLDPRGHYSDLELWNCLEFAQLKETVTRMACGLDTEIIEGGFNLSAGQRQLFCLARAVLRGSVCLVLDEATSSLDAITEKALMDAAHNAFKGRTILTIAHRLSTLMNYDRIIVLENGKIIEDGTPNELKAIPNGKFSSMLQSGH